MQTFLPWASFTNSAVVLDRARLGKQRVEAMQIMQALTRPDEVSPARRNHPAVRMWGGYELSLLNYTEAICTEWTRRRFVDNCLDKTKRYLGDWVGAGNTPSRLDPLWLGTEALHLSHRQNLYRKDPDHYGPFFEDDIEPREGYVWPVPLRGRPSRPR